MAAKKKLKETPAAARKRMAQVLEILRGEFPEAKCSLDYETPYQLLVATILSAQCTDERVNKVTPALFKRFPGPKEAAAAKLSELEKLVKSTGFYKNKALSIREMSRAVLEKHGGVVPQTLEELTALRGVGRKTANVLLGNAFGIPGMVVDTHVGRLARRLGFTAETDPVKVEYALMEVVPREDWALYSHLMIYHGRKTCMARSPRCGECPLAALCPRVGVN